MVATALTIGDVAIIAANTEDTGNPQRDLISIILLKPIGSGTTIYITDRNWNGTSFATAAGDGTITYVAGTDLAAGTVLHFTQAQLTAAGINLSDAGDTLYLYQGTTADAPTRFLHAVDIGDATSGFPANALLNTGLVNGTSAVAFGTGAGIADIDNAEFGGRTHNIQMSELFTRINTASAWTQNSNSPQDGTAAGTPAFTAPDAQIWVAGAGGGEGIVTVNLDATYSAGTLGYQIAQAFQNDPGLFRPTDITLDTVEGLYFFVDSDANGNNRIIQGSISQLLSNPGGPLTTTVLYSNTGTGDGGVISSLSVDTVNNRIYFDVGIAGDGGSTINRINYNTAAQTPTVLATLGAGQYVTQMAIDYTRGEVFVAVSQITAVFGQDFISHNYIYRAVAAGGTAAALASASSLTFTTLPFSPNDTAQTGEGSPLPGNAFPVERGNVRGIDVDPVTHALLIVTGSASLDNDGNGSTTYTGGIYRYALDSNPTGTYTTLYQQTGTPGAAGTGPRGLLYYIEVDAATGRYYVIDESGLNSDPGDASVWTGSLTVPGMPTLLATVGNINGLGARGLEILHAPTLTGTNLAPTITETAGNPSPDPTAVAIANAFTANDSDSADSPTNQLAGAQVRISSGFQSGAGHQDVLSISGALPGGITANYNATTGVLTLSGISTFANYQTALAQVRFTVQGDNPTNYGANTTRTLSFSTFDGALYSDEVNATVTVVGINDAPVNTVGGALNINEDAAATALTGISITDVDADPAATLMTVQFSVARGTITLNTAVAGGVTAGQITAGANGSATLTVTATQNAINATLANATGLTYTPTANINGADALTIVTSDGGATGTGGTLSDTDTKTINVTAVNDAPVATSTFVPTASILEDTPSATGDLVSALYGPLFSDATDQVTGGSSANTLAGVVVISNPASANGAWQYFNGAAWVNITTGVTAATGFALSASTAIRFNPAPNFGGGDSPVLRVVLVDNSGGAITTGTAIDASVRGGTTRFSTDQVSWTTSVTAVNDAPTSTGLATDSVTTTEPAGAGSTMPSVKIDAGGNATIADVDNVTFNGGSIRFAITAGLVAAQDQLVIDTAAATTVTVAGNVVSVGGTAIGTVTGGGAGGADLVVALNASATPALVQTLIRAIDFANTGGDNPTAGARTITTTLIDGGGTANLGQDTLTITSTVTVAATNDAPTITGFPNSGTLTLGVAGNVDMSPTTIADADSTTLTVTITTVFPGSYTTATVAGVTVGGSGTTLTLTGTAAALNTYLDTVTNVRFTPTLYNGSANFNIDVSDGSLSAGPRGASYTVTFVPNPVAAFGTAITQNFDLLTSGGGSSLTPLGWTLAESGTSSNTSLLSSDGSSNIGDTYSFGALGNSDRAFGGVQSGTLIPTVGGAFTNNTGGLITSLVVTYTGEQWRLGATGRNDRLDFQYSTNATSLTIGTWTDVDALDFTAPQSTGTAGALNGNLAANRTAITFEITGLSIAPGTTFWFRWNDFNATGADDGLAIDDFSLTARSVVANSDTASVNENVTLTGLNLLTNDTNAGGGPALTVASVNGSAANVGTQITLASGALLTVNANGTYSYNPNGQFNYLIDAATAAATGAVNSSAVENFTYTLAGGQTATASITINGVAGAGDQLRGGAGNNTINGTGLDDFFNLTQGGDDTVTGGAGNDAFLFGPSFTIADNVDGGPGTNDQVGLQGAYPALTLGANSLVNVEVLAALPGFSYNVTSVDANVPAGQELVIFGGNLGAGDNFTFNGSAETDGRFRMYGGLGTDTFTGGTLDDGFYFGPGKWGPTDVVIGGGGANDQLALDGTYTVIMGGNVDVETLILLSGPVATPNTFNVTLSDFWTAAGATKTVWGINVTTAMTIDGSLETNGNLTFFAGQNSDTLMGGTGNDAIYGNAGGDAITGGAGNDTFRYDAVTDSNGATNATRDRILDFSAGDKIDLSRIDAIAGGADDAFMFIGTAAFSGGGASAGQLRYTDAGGGIYIIEGDVNGDGVADFTLSVTTAPATPPVATDFVL